MSLFLREHQGVKLNLGNEFRKYFDLIFYHEGQDDEKFMYGRERYKVIDEEIALHAKIFIEFVALIIRNRIHVLLKEQMLKTHQKENYMTVPVAIRELEKIEIVRQTDGEYYRDYTVTATQKAILKAFGLSEINVGKQTVDINEDLRTCNAKEA